MASEAYVRGKDESKTSNLGSYFDNAINPYKNYYAPNSYRGHYKLDPILFWAFTGMCIGFLETGELYLAMGLLGVLLPSTVRISAYILGNFRGLNNN